MRPNKHARMIGPPTEVAPKINPTLRGTGGNLVQDLLEEVQARVGPPKKSRLPKCYRSVLNLEPEDLIAFFDTQIGTRTEFEPADSVIPPEMLQHRIALLQKIIAASKEIVTGLSVHIMKIRRDEVLDKPTREKYKREENARQARCNVKLFRYRAALRSGNYREKVWQWVKHPVFFHDVVDDVMVFATATNNAAWLKTHDVFSGAIQTHTRVQLFDEIRYGQMNLESYRAIVALGVPALEELGETESEQKAVWENVWKWENAVICAAVRLGVIAPRRDLAEQLGFKHVLNAPEIEINGEERVEENALAIKTGGACYGGSIRGEGFRFRGGKLTPRALSSFDKPGKADGNGRDNVDGGGYEDPGFAKGFSDDAESYDPR